MDGVILEHSINPLPFLLVENVRKHLFYLSDETLYFYKFKVYNYLNVISINSLFEGLMVSLGVDEITKSKYAANKLYGLSVTTYFNGRKKKLITYVNGLMQGLAQEFYPNGTLRKEIHYVEGVATGTLTSYYSTGQRHKVVLLQKEDLICITYSKNGSSIKTIVKRNEAHIYRSNNFVANFLI